jgi:hypothetical protein
LERGVGGWDVEMLVEMGFGGNGDDVPFVFSMTREMRRHWEEGHGSQNPSRACGSMVDV